MKTAIALSLFICTVAVTGCSDGKITPQYIKEAERLCSTHKGLEKMSGVSFAGSVNVYCLDGSFFTMIGLSISDPTK